MEYPRLMYRGDETTRVEDAAGAAQAMNEGWTLRRVPTVPEPEPVVEVPWPDIDAEPEPEPKKKGRGKAH